MNHAAEGVKLIGIVLIFIEGQMGVTAHHNDIFVRFKQAFEAHRLGIRFFKGDLSRIIAVVAVAGTPVPERCMLDQKDVRVGLVEFLEGFFQPVDLRLGEVVVDRTVTWPQQFLRHKDKHIVTVSLGLALFDDIIIRRIFKGMHLVSAQGIRRKQADTRRGIGVITDGFVYIFKRYIRGVDAVDIIAVFIVKVGIARHIAHDDHAVDFMLREEVQRIFPLCARTEAQSLKVYVNIRRRAEAILHFAELQLLVGIQVNDIHRRFHARMIGKEIAVAFKHRELRRLRRQIGTVLHGIRHRTARDGNARHLVILLEQPVSVRIIHQIIAACSGAFRGCHGDRALRKACLILFITREGVRHIYFFINIEHRKRRSRHITSIPIAEHHVTDDHGACRFRFNADRLHIHRFGKRRKVPRVASVGPKRLVSVLAGRSGIAEIVIKIAVRVHSLVIRLVIKPNDKRHRGRN